MSLISKYKSFSSINRYLVRTILIWLILIISNLSVAQPDSIWTRIYGGRSSDRLWDMIQTRDRGFALVGEYYGYHLDLRGLFCLVKTDSLGTQEWLRYWNMGETECAWSAVQTDDNGYILVGSDGYIMKVDAHGDSLWARQYENVMKLKEIRSVTENTFLISGMGHTPENRQDLILLKINERGELIWRRRYNFEGLVWNTDLDFTYDGKFVLSGQYVLPDDRGIYVYSTGFAVKVDSNGEMEWRRNYGIIGNYAISCVAQMPDSGFIFGGVTYAEDPERRYYAVRANSEGEVIWETLPTDRYGKCHDVAVTDDGGIILVGYGLNLENRENHGDFYLVRLDFEGNLIYEKCIGSLDSDHCYSIIPQPDGGYALGGQTRSGDHNRYGSCSFWLVRTGPDIVRLFGAPDTSFGLGRTLSIDLSWFRQFISPDIYLDTALTWEASDGGRYANARIEDGHLRICANPYNFRTGADTVYLNIAVEDNPDNHHNAPIRVTITDPRGIENLSDYHHAATFVMYPAYPNPFNATTKIAYQLPEATNIEISILDLNGRQIEVLDQGVRTAGRHQLMWNAGFVPSGTYYIQLRTADGIHLTKASLIK